MYMEENPYIKEFANRLYILRTEQNVSAREMSLSLGQTHSYINGIELEKCFPSMLNFFYICEYLNVTPFEFFDYTNTIPKQTNILYNEIKKLDEISQLYFLELIRFCP